jgi:hypothetical protein
MKLGLFSWEWERKGGTNIHDPVAPGGTFDGEGGGREVDIDGVEGG